MEKVDFKMEKLKFKEEKEKFKELEKKFKEEKEKILNKLKEMKLFDLNEVIIKDSELGCFVVKRIRKYKDINYEGLVNNFSLDEFKEYIVDKIDYVSYSYDDLLDLENKYGEFLEWKNKDKEEDEEDEVEYYECYGNKDLLEYVEKICYLNGDEKGVEREEYFRKYISNEINMIIKCMLIKIINEEDDEKEMKMRNEMELFVKEIKENGVEIVLDYGRELYKDIYLNEDVIELL